MQEDRQPAREKAAAIVREGFEETFSYYVFPPEYWRRRSIPQSSL
ncbi:MAG TPA: hypothetical protein PLA90_02605 [Candidatus Sumerlaeota bacterium]|nr:hypothetical protein [Candidatus Sumerlaeota bacterium]HPS00411.1 hypothetical protein [Candidatus Sumerlaeota bacterium]